MNHIREARAEDAPVIRDLLEQLGYNESLEFVKGKLTMMLADNSYKVIVYELDGRVVSFMTIHFYIQIAYQGEFVGRICDNRIFCCG